MASRIAGGVVTMFLVVLVIGVGRWVDAQEAEGVVGSTELTSETVPEPQAVATDGTGLLYGRVTLDDGAVHEGRLRFGGDEEALWSNYFNGFKAVNPWVDLVPRELRPTDRRGLKVFGFEFAGRDVPRDLGRPFMARFGDIVRLDARGRDLRVTLKSGMVVSLDRFAADDYADGLTLWDSSGKVMELGEWGIRSIEFLPGMSSGAPAPRPLYGTVRTSQGDFTGLIQWDREAALVTDDLEGFPFEGIESIERTQNGALISLRNGRMMELSGSRKVGDGNRGIYVDDRRYGRVLVSWDAFERIDFSAADGAPGYEAYAAGTPLRGTVTARSGRTLTGRIVYDLDESETTETLDAPWMGVDYMIPFGMIESIVGDTASDAAASDEPVDHAFTLVLASGEVRRLERGGDLGDANAGLLVLDDGSADPEYVPWVDVHRVDFRSPSES